MTYTLIALVLIGLLAYALERNHRRQVGPRPPLAGSSDVMDRDAQRVEAELTYLSGSLSHRQPTVRNSRTATAQEPKTRNAPRPAALGRLGAAGRTR
ncbi:hypothetical protein ABIA33_003177 [Streptacidiphilus sp. MAP12-16]|uniref:hypothetical protein n=1 Tax=Streptacidiphilus sp. MAP12-16 TaxID=3156300 RepID=UPI003516F0C5